MRLLLISDIHEDFRFLQRVFSKAEKQGFDKAACLGDISGFSVPFYKYYNERDARSCLQLVREKCEIVIPGNHDYYAAKRVPGTPGVVTVPENWYKLDYQEQANVAGGQLWLNRENELEPLYSEEDIDYLRTLPEYRVLEQPGKNILLSHYVFPNMAGFEKGFYQSAADFSAHLEFMEKHDCGISFTGHAHIKGFSYLAEGSFGVRKYGNLGLHTFPVVLGLPPVTRHKKRSGFCIFDTENQQLRVFRI